MKTRITFAILASLALSALAQVPQEINYQGRIAVQGINFTGPGQFKFALLGTPADINQTATATPEVNGAGDGQGPRVLSITVDSAGSGYVDPPDVTIISGSGATGATAHAVLDGAGGVLEIIVDTDGVGQGYEMSDTTVIVGAPPAQLVAPTLWSNDGTSVNGSEPTDAVPLNVSGGLYSVRLGNTALTNMTVPVTAAVAAGGTLSLRVWFDDLANGSQLLSPDQPLASVPWALKSETALTADSALTVPDGSITGDKLAPGSITGGLLAPGTLDSTHLLALAPPDPGQILSYDGTGFQWVPPAGGGGDSVFSLNGTDAFYNSGNVGIGTSVPTHKFAVNGGPSWTSNFWTGSMVLAHPGAIGWNKNGSGQAFGMGYTNGGFAMFRTTSDPGTTTGPAIYDLFINDAGCVCIGTVSPNPGYRLAVNGGVQFTPGGTGGTMQFGTPNFETGMTWTNATTRADLRFNGTTVKLLAGPAGGPPGNTSGIAVRTNGNVGIGTEDPQAKLHVIGTIRTSVLTITGGADLAEPFPMSHSGVEAGAVVSIDPEHPGKLRMSTSAYDRTVAGIVSGANGINPGISMIDEAQLEPGENVALSGRVYVKANSSAGVIAPGDLLTTSDIPGEAMKAADHQRAQGSILGKAMTPLDETTGTVLVLVTLQ